VDAEHAVHRNHCNRAPTAWAAVAGRTHRLFDSVAFLACSGARTFNVEHAVPPSQHAPAPTPTPQYNEPHTQLDEVDELNLRLGEKLDPSLVVVSLGGNDAGFSTIGEMCLAPGNCGVKRSLWLDNLPTVREALEKTFGEIRAEFPQAPVLVVPYPAPLYTDAKGNPRKCGQVALSVDDMRFINTFLRRLNKTVKAAAGARQFYFLGAMEQSLADAHLQLCDPHNDKRPGINFIGLRSVGGIAAQRFNPKNWYHNSLHPNERGHAAMLQAFEQWRADNPDPPRDAPRVGGDGDKGRSGGAVTNPPCDIVEDDQSTTQHCREAGAEWAKGQVRNALVRHFWGLQILLAALAAWVMGVALFGWWKPWWPDRPGPPPSE
jgi:lysophospholipase L1-like esterase